MSEKFTREFKVWLFVVLGMTFIGWYGVTMLTLITWWGSHLDRWLGLKP